MEIQNKYDQTHHFLILQDGNRTQPAGMDEIVNTAKLQLHGQIKNLSFQELRDPDTGELDPNHSYTITVTAAKDMWSFPFSLKQASGTPKSFEEALDELLDTIEDHLAPSIDQTLDGYFEIEGKILVYAKRDVKTGRLFFTPIPCFCLPPLASLTKKEEGALLIVQKRGKHEKGREGYIFNLVESPSFFTGEFVRHDKDPNTAPFPIEKQCLILYETREDAIIGI